jgi:hypothetical protein
MFNSSTGKDLGMKYNQADTVARAIGQDNDGTIRGTEFVTDHSRPGILALDSRHTFATVDAAQAWMHQILTSEERTDYRDEWAKRTFAGETDRELSERLFYVEARLIEGQEMDTWHEGNEDEYRQLCQTRDAINYELTRRVATGEEVEDDRSIETELAPFGPEWEREQQERMMYA